jgi:hypothetical protein
MARKRSNEGRENLERIIEPWKFYPEEWLQAPCGIHLKKNKDDPRAHLRGHLSWCEKCAEVLSKGGNA